MHFPEGAPNYYPNSFSGPQDNLKFKECPFKLSGDVDRYNTQDDDNFTQVGTFWRKVLSPEERTKLVENIAGHAKDAQEFIQKRVVKNWGACDPELGRRLQEAFDKYKSKSPKSAYIGSPASL